MTNQIPSLRFCGQPVDDKHLALIKEIVTEYGLPRTEMADTVCELLDWTRPNGKLKRVECLQFLETLEAAGYFKLPEHKNRRSAKARKAKRTEDCEQTFALNGSLQALGKVGLHQVTTQKERDLWKELVDRHHYLGYRVPFGASLRYLILAHERDGAVLGCLQFSSPAWKVAARDAWIGWRPEVQKMNLQRIVQNSRFLILPDVQVKGLASHVLSLAAKRIGDDWEKAYSIRPVLLETFVDVNRFRGTCYKAANWQELGETRGRGRMDRHSESKEPVKSIWVYPLRRDWRKRLCNQGSVTR